MELNKDNSKKLMIVWCNSSTFTKPSRINIPYHLVRIYEVADYLEKSGIDVECMDMELNHDEFDDIIKRVLSHEFSCIAFWATSENLPNVMIYSNIIKEIDPTIKLIVYGEINLIIPYYFIKSKFDAIVRDNTDSEISLLDFFEYSIGHKKIEEIRGIYINDGEKLIKTKEGDYIQPEKWGVPNDKYFGYNELIKIGKSKQITLSITKGCPYNCKYCLTPKIEGNKYRKRPVKDIIEFINKHEYSIYKFFSAFFTLDREYVENLCNELIRNKKKIRWSCCTRASNLQDEEMISLMAKAGCYKISVGVESLSMKDLKTINKKTEVNHIINSLKLVKKYNIEYKALIMLGIPGQTKENVENTIKILREYNATIRPTAYTPFYDLKENDEMYEICKYDKWTYFNGLGKLSYGEFLKLLYSIDDCGKYNVKDVE